MDSNDPPQLNFTLQIDASENIWIRMTPHSLTSPSNKKQSQRKKKNMLEKKAKQNIDIGIKKA